MNQIAKTVSLVVTLLGVLGALVYLATREAPNAAVIATLGAAFGAGATAAFKYFTSGNGATGPGAVLLVAAATSLASPGCMPANTPREQARSVVLSVAEGVRAGDEAC